MENLKSLKDYTPEELKEYYEDMNNEMLIEEELMKRAEEKEEEYEPEYWTDYEPYLED